MSGDGGRRQWLVGTAAAALAPWWSRVTRADASVHAGADTAAPQGWQTPGGEFTNYGTPADDGSRPIRWISAENANPRSGVSWAPLHELEGFITPNALHFERHHNGVPAIDGAAWQLLIDGLVADDRVLDLAALRGLRQYSRIAFVECGGNSNALWHEPALQSPAGYLHGLVSCAQWTGVRLSSLLEPAGLHADARWLIATGLDSAGVTVSLPLAPVLEKGFIALYQNGEPLRAENGYPARLIIPGWEGITHVKWLGRLHVSDKPALSRFDSVSYTDLQADGRARRFTHEMGVKSVITRPTTGDTVAAGEQWISGLAWSGAGYIERVELSTDAGASWQAAELSAPVLDRALTRFGVPWHFAGKPTVLLSRAIDSVGNTQPTRTQLIAEQGSNAYYHYNAIVAWSVDADGRVHHVYA